MIELIYVEFEVVKKTLPKVSIKVIWLDKSLSDINYILCWKIVKVIQDCRS